MKVFILDDDEEWVEMFQTVLQNAKHELRYYISPDDAVRDAFDEMPNIVISDYIFKGAGIMGDALLCSEPLRGAPVRVLYSHNHFNEEFQKRLNADAVRCFWKRTTSIEELCGSLGIIEVTDHS